MSKIPNSFTVRVASAGLQVVAAATRGQRAAGRRSGAGQRAAESGAGREVRRRQRRGWRARREVRRSRGCTRRDGLWRRRDEDDGEEEDIAVDERDSLGLPLPVSRLVLLTGTKDPRALTRPDMESTGTKNLFLVPVFNGTGTIVDLGRPTKDGFSTSGTQAMMAAMAAVADEADARDGESATAVVDDGERMRQRRMQWTIVAAMADDDG
uniref:Uncharacterized protein n=1 Tax=Oryza rufipogon TaxID=4529 RepID=A0A0E0P009_ORYRU